MCSCISVGPSCDVSTGPRTVWIAAITTIQGTSWKYAADPPGCRSPDCGRLLGPAPAHASRDLTWWKNAVIYEIYPRSFADTNGDGIGDLNGIIQHLDYLQDLGCDAIWITPFCPSPQVDFGYDIADYENIEPQYGTLADFDRLVAECSRRHIRVIADLVLNHSSDRNSWFQESRASQTNPKADWYIWHDAKPDGSPPNNWQSVFGHSAWTWEPARGQYYYHKFFTQQPDLNWRNPEVRRTMYDVARFWMKRGVAGFRLDAIGTLFEDPLFRDEPLTGGVNAFGDPNIDGIYTENLPEVHDVLRELRQVSDEFKGRVLIGETYTGSVGELLSYYGAANDELQLPMDTQHGFIDQLSADAFRQALREAETQLNGNVPLFVFDNHDSRRSWDRYGDGVHDLAIAKLIATLLLAPRGAVLLYYGQEIGMRNNDPTSLDQVLDPVGRIGWPDYIGRDGERTPMQWNAGPNAGFSSGPSTWLPVGPDYPVRNVEVESQDPASLLNYYKTLIRLRKENPALRDGVLTLVDETNSNVLSFLRSGGGNTVLVAMNLTASPQTVRLDPGSSLTILASSFDSPERSITMAQFELPAFGAVVAVEQVSRPVLSSLY